ncbi:hypothetical protein, partial [Sessilibacter sp. MAH4]
EGENPSGSSKYKVFATRRQRRRSPKGQNNPKIVLINPDRQSNPNLKSFTMLGLFLFSRISAKTSAVREGENPSGSSKYKVFATRRQRRRSPKGRSNLEIISTILGGK